MPPFGELNQWSIFGVMKPEIAGTTGEYMGQNRPDGIDLLVTCVLGVVIVAVVLVAYAPTQDAPTLWSRIWHDAGWPLILAIVSTFVAAFAGTWGAQTVAERIAARKELLAEIRSVNAALALSFNITNTYVTVKKQHVQQLVEKYEAAKMEHADAVENNRGTFSVLMDLRELSAPFCPVNELRAIMLEKITPSINALMTLTPLIQSVEGLTETIKKRNAWITQFESRSRSLSEIQKAALYLGFEFSPGQTDVRYNSYMDALKSQTDDCIAFPIIISQSLKAYGKELRKRYGSDAPEIVSGSFQQSSEYIPDMNTYKDWNAT